MLTFRKQPTFFFGEKINGQALHFHPAFNELIQLANVPFDYTIKSYGNGRVEGK
jgi:hypothetical protein